MNYVILLNLIKIAHLIRYACYEAFYVQLSRTGFLTGRIGAFQTPCSFSKSTPFRKCCVFYVVKIVLQRSTRLEEL